MRFLLRLLLSAVLSFGVFAVDRPAPVQADNCSINITWYEDNYGGGRHYTGCYGNNWPNLGVAPLIQGCIRAFGQAVKNWDNCISSFRITTNCHYPVWLYYDVNDQQLWRGYETSVFVPDMGPVGYANDAISSVRIGHRVTCPLERL